MRLKDANETAGQITSKTVRALKNINFQSKKSRNIFQKPFQKNFGGVQRAFEREAIDFVVNRGNNHSSVGVFHFDVASFAMNFDKSTLQAFNNLSTGKQRKFHIANSTISRPRFAVSISSGSR